MTTIKEMIKAKVEAIGSEVATMGLEAGIWGKAGAEKMASYLQSPAFLRAFYEENGLPMCICSKYCTTCDKHLHSTTGVDWGKQ